MVDVELGLTDLGVHPLSADTFLLLSEQFWRHVVVVMSPEQLLLFISELHQLARDLVSLRASGPLELFSVPPYRVAYFLPVPGCQLDRSVLPRDSLLDGLGAVMRLFTRAGAPSRAHEVFVDSAMASCRSRVDQPIAAGSAKHGAPQIAVMSPATFTRAPLTVEHLLDTLKGGFVGQLRVPPFRHDAGIPNHPDVVVVSQNLLEPIRSDWRRRLASAWPVAKPALLEHCCHFGEGVASRGVQLESCADVVAALGVNRDGTNFAILDPIPTIHVTDRGATGRSATPRFFGRAFHDLGGQVQRVKLSDRRHDSVQQHAGWAFVDVLGHGNKLCPGLADRVRDHDVVCPPAREAIDLVDDHVVDTALTYPR